MRLIGSLCMCVQCAIFHPCIDPLHVICAASCFRCCFGIGRAGMLCICFHILLFLCYTYRISYVNKGMGSVIFIIFCCGNSQHNCIMKFFVQLTVYNYKGGPCYRCLFPTPPPTTACQRCSDSGVLGVGKLQFC